MARFDLAEASQLESRDGGVSKGGLVRNGFVERDGEEVWSWQRPALVSSSSAPIAGNGLGLMMIGTALWGVYHNGTTTATSQLLPL